MPDFQKAPDELPSGYRQGIVTAVSIFLTFSLLFLRFWGFEASGEWNLPSLIATILMFVAVLVQIGTLWRALQVKDSLLVEYNLTLKWLFTSIGAMMLSVVIAAISYSISAS